MEMMMTEEILKKGERTRQVILDSAYGLIIEQGYAATSMRQIADKAGLALGSIYNHFTSKEDVFSSIIQERHPFLQILPVLKSVQGVTVEEYVRTAAQTLVEQLGHHPDFLNLMLTEIVEFHGGHVPLLFERFLPMALPIAKHIASLDGKTREIPPFILARAFLGMFLSYYITEILMAPVNPHEWQTNALDHFVDIFLHGILIKETV
jgi:AcrR family transcriptional regulator